MNVYQHTSGLLSSTSASTTQQIVVTHESDMAPKTRVGNLQLHSSSSIERSPSTSSPEQVTKSVSSIATTTLAPLVNEDTRQVATSIEENSTVAPSVVLPPPPRPSIVLSGAPRPSVQLSTTYMKNIPFVQTNSRVTDGVAHEDSKQPEPTPMDDALPNGTPKNNPAPQKEAAPMANYLDEKLASISDKDVRRLVSLVFASCAGMNTISADMLRDVEKYITSRHSDYVYTLQKLPETDKRDYIQKRMKEILSIAGKRYSFSEEVLQNVFNSLLKEAPEVHMHQESSPCCIVM